MATIYELQEEFQQLLSMAEEGNIEQRVINDTLESLSFEFDGKAEGYGKVIKELEATVDAVEKEIKRLSEKKSTIKNNIARIKKNLENAMIATDRRKIKTALFSFSIQKNPARLKISDDAKIPGKYLIEQPAKVDKKAIIEDLKNGAEYDGLKIVQTESLRIR
jgi:septal ring factor EnvC (AmiA/AmiB activator)